MEKRKALISRPWKDEDVIGVDDYIQKLKAENFEIVFFPELRDMSVEDLKKWGPGTFAHICGVDKWTAEAMDACPGLRIISRIGAGYDSVDIEAATARKILVCNTPGTTNVGVAEYAMLAIAAMARRITWNDTGVRANKWPRIIGRSWYKKTLGIIGFGQIGKQVAKFAQGYDMKILVYDVYQDRDYAKKNNVTYVALEELLKQSDYVTVHVLKSPQTINLITMRELSLMKPTGMLVCCARGGIVNELDLYNALKDRIIEFAAMDVFEKEPINPDNPLLTLDNIILSAHNAGNSHESISLTEHGAVQNVLDIIHGIKPLGLRNPEVF
jgi:phosphoglycerate dehydrogenase-like enzyme